MKEMEDLQKALDERYRKKEDCDDIHREVSRKFSSDDKRIEILIHDFHIFKWIGGIIAGATVSQLIATIAGRLM